MDQIRVVLATSGPRICPWGHRRHGIAPASF